MTNPLKRGEIWLADLNPTQGSEQAGIRPVIIFQNDLVSQFSTTTIAIPLTTNQRRAALPICLLIEQGNGGAKYNAPHISDRAIREKKLLNHTKITWRNFDNAAKKTQCGIQGQNSAGSSEGLKDSQRNS
jgi:mRNA-degrading endonuclease toxin of MazEF toxin-antitoxin module